MQKIPHANELANIGACRDKWENDTMSCYKCELIFKMDEIIKTKDERKLSFEDAGWLIHAKYHPWCELLQKLPKCTLQKILGNV